MTEKGRISITQSGAEVVVEWRIGRFFTLSKEDGARYYSPNFTIVGETWCLYAYPNGWSENDTYGYVDLEVRKLPRTYSGVPIRKALSLSLKTVKGEKNYEENFTKEFKGWDCHLFNRFLPRSELSRRQSEPLPRGVLTVVCSMKDTTSDEGDKEEASNAKVNKSDVAEASGLSEPGTITTKESVLKWIKENCEEASKGKKRKTEKENVLKWIEENCKETSEGKKRKTEENTAAEKLLQDLKGIMVNGEHSDVTVSVRGEEFRLHRSILGIRNPFFSMRFNNESQETVPGTLSIDDCDPDQFRTLIHYIYTGTADNLCPENVCGLYDVAVTYQEQQMRAECLQLLMNTLYVDNFCDYTSLALEHDVEELLQKATELFVRKVKEITRHEKWEAFLGKYPAEANKLYMKVLDQYDTK